MRKAAKSYCQGHGYREGGRIGAKFFSQSDTLSNTYSMSIKEVLVSGERLFQQWAGNPVLANETGGQLQGFGGGFWEMCSYS